MTSFIIGSRGEATRTPDLYVPNVARYQLRYTPIPLFCECKITKSFRITQIFRCFFSVFLSGLLLRD